MTVLSLCTSVALGRPLSLGRPIFRPSVHGERMSAGHLLQSSSSRFTLGVVEGHCSVHLKRASAHSRSIANWFSISGYADRPRKGNHPSARPVWLGATGQGLEWSAGADDRLNAGIGPAANSNNNVRGDMPFDEPFGARLQRSLQLAVFLLGPQRCRERALHFFATFEVRKVSHSIMRLQRSRQVE